MKLLILTQYFPPETGAAQNRLFELATRLQSSGVDVTVLTAMPNYPQMRIYEGYATSNYIFEEISGLKVHRSSIFVSTSKSIVSRLRSYFSFVLSSALVATRKLGHFDFILCESPPLFLGYTAMYLARKTRAKLIFNVSDLWPESAEKLGVVENKFLLRKAYALEEKIYKSAALVSGQTQGICRSINQRFPQVKTYWLPNGVDLEYYDPDKIKAGDWRERNGFTTDDFIVLYAGIIGMAQGLEVVLYAADCLRSIAKVKFVLLGSGPEKEKLLELKRELKLDNVFFLETVPKKQIPAILKSSNAAVIPLKRIELFNGAIPSKIFECIAMKLPILLGVDGEARELFIENGKCGLYFEPNKSGELASGIERLINNPNLRAHLGDNGRRYAGACFDRTRIAMALLEEIRKL